MPAQYNLKRRKTYGSDQNELFLLKNSWLVAKGDKWHYWIHYDYEWHKDTESIVWGKLIGYDPSEPADSPYAIGSTSVMDEIEEIDFI